MLNGTAAGRSSDEQVTVFDSVGFALEDYTALCFMREQSIALGIGEPLPLIPALADPKDLFSVLATAQLPAPRQSGRSRGLLGVHDAPRF